MLEKDKVTVVVPVYNVEPYLTRCLDSVLGQTYSNIEVIVVNDGSKDHSGEICNEYARKDSRVKVIHQENRGQSKARNEAMKIATGEFFCFVDADDYMHENQIQRLIELLYDHAADISMVHFCNFSGKQVSGADISENAGNSSVISGQLVEMSGTDCIKNMHMVQDELYVVMWAKLFKRELFEGISFPEGRICEDLAVLYRVFDEAKTVVYSKEVMYYYFRDNQGSSTFSIKDKFYKDVFLALDEEIEYMEQYHRELVDYPRKTYLYWIFDYYRKLYRADQKGNKSKCLELHKKYKEIYLDAKGLKKEKFYTAFYYAPQLYLKIKK